jgi:sirohydrochlorin ferrochelatase
LLEAAQATYPQIAFTMGDYLGHDPLLADVIMERAATAS